MVRGILWRIRARGRPRRARQAPPVTGYLNRLREAIVELGVDPARASLKRADQVVAGRFEFLNHREDIGAINWDRRYVDRLWTYNLHYFDYAVDLAWAFRLTREQRYVGVFESLVSTWIDKTEPGEGDAWDPYPISLRTVNWIYALLLLEDSVSPGLRGRVAVSLFQQLHFLERRIEWHLLGNHVIKNLKALFIGGLFFEADPAHDWRTKAAHQLWEQVKEQVYPDGGHFERSPMYHGIVLCDLVEIIQLMRSQNEKVPVEIEDRTRQMLPAMALLTRQDKSLRLLNDSARGVSPSYQYLEKLCSCVFSPPASPVVSEWSLPETGYYGYRDTKRRSDLIISCREPSPGYQPGHSHCDILSYEWDVRGEPVIVDSGLHGYDGDPFREYVRSTRAHNTVSVFGKNQSEAWATFRFGRRAKEVRGSSRFSGGVYIFEGSYRPYHDLNSVHRRSISLQGDELTIVDVVEKNDATLVESFLHFHPDFSLSVTNGRALAVKGPVIFSIEPFGIDELSVIRGENQPTQGWYCEEFGKAIPQYVLVMRIENNRGIQFGYRIRRVSGSS